MKKEWINSLRQDKGEENLEYRFSKFQTYLLDNQHNINNKLTKQKIFYKYAAIILLFLFVSLLTYKIYNTIRANFLTTTILADKGNISSVILPDSTIVWLNSQSKLSYNNNYGKNNRNVTLQGEAYFKVLKNTNKPFIVNSRDFKIKVLGTVFNVRSYTDEKESSVALEKGSIELYNNSNDDKIKVLAGERIVCDANHSLHRQKIGNTKKYSAWHNGQDIFYNSPLKDVTDKLNEKYNCNIILEKKLYDIKVTFFAENSKLSESLDIIKSIIPVEIIKKDSIIFINNNLTQKTK